MRKRESMKQLLVASLFVSLAMSQITFSGNQSSSFKKEKKPLEKFEFSKMEEKCINMIPHIVSFAWDNLDNHSTFEKALLSPHINNYLVLKSETTYSEQNNYKFHGWKVPVYLYTLKEGSPAIKIAGNVLNLAQHANLSGFWYADSSVETTELFLDAPDETQYHTTLHNGTFTRPNILSACLSVLGDIALVWETTETDKIKYVTLTTVKAIIENKIIDVSKDAKKLDDSEFVSLKGDITDAKTIKGCIFTLDGSKLGICKMKHLQLLSRLLQPSALKIYIEHINTSPHSVQYLDIKQDKPLTIEEKAKRLGIATLSVKKLLKENKKKQSMNE